jgi:hypothetical protein
LGETSKYGFSIGLLAEGFNSKKDFVSKRIKKVEEEEVKPVLENS